MEVVVQIAQRCFRVPKRNRPVEREELGLSLADRSTIVTLIEREFVEAFSHSLSHNLSPGLGYECVVLDRHDRACKDSCV